MMCNSAEVMILVRCATATLNDYPFTQNRGYPPYRVWLDLSFRVLATKFTGIELMHMIRKGQMMTEAGNEMSFADQFYALAD